MFEGVRMKYTKVSESHPYVVDLVGASVWREVVRERFQGLELRIFFREKNAHVIFKGQETHAACSNGNSNNGENDHPPAMFYDPGT